MADSSESDTESDLCEVTSSPNFTAMFTKAKQIISTDYPKNKLPKIADTIENIIKRNFRKSIIRRAVHPSIVCSTPFAPDKMKNNVSFPTISTLSESSEEQKNQSYREPQSLIPLQKEIPIVDVSRQQTSKTDISANEKALIVVNSIAHQISKPCLNTSIDEKALVIEEFSEQQTSKQNISALEKNAISNIANDCRLPGESGFNKSNEIINMKNKSCISTENSQEKLEKEKQLTSKLNKRKLESSEPKQNDSNLYDSRSLSKRKKALERKYENSSNSAFSPVLTDSDKSSFSQYIPEKKGVIIKDKKYFPLIQKMGKIRARSLSKTKKNRKKSDNESHIELKKKKDAASKTIGELKYSSSEESDYSVLLDRPIKLKTKKIKPQGKLIYVEDDPVMASDQKITKQRINKGRSISRKRKEYFHDWGSSDKKVVNEVLERNNLELKRYPQIKRRTRLVEVSMSDSDIPGKEERIIYYHNVPKSSSRRYLKDISSLPEVEHRHRVVPSRYYEPTSSYIVKNDSERPKLRRNYSRPRRTYASLNQINFSSEEYTSECEATKNFRHEKKSTFKRNSRLSRRDSYILEKKIQNDKNVKSVERNIEQSSFPSTVHYGSHEKFLDTPHQVIDPQQQDIKLMITEIVNEHLNNLKNVNSEPSNKSKIKGINKTLDNACEITISNNKNIYKNNILSENCTSPSLELLENVDKIVTVDENSDISINKTLDNACQTTIPNNKNINKNNILSKNCTRASFKLLENVDKIVSAAENSDNSCPFDKFHEISITEKKKILKRLARGPCSESDWVYNYIFPTLEQRTQKCRKSQNDVLNRNSLSKIVELLSKKPSEIVNVDTLTSSKEFQKKLSSDEKHEIQSKNINVSTNNNSLLPSSLEHNTNSKTHKIKEIIDVASLPSDKIIIHSITSIADGENANKNYRKNPLTRNTNETIMAFEAGINVASNLNDSCPNSFLELTGIPKKNNGKESSNDDEEIQNKNVRKNSLTRKMNETIMEFEDGINVASNLNYSCPNSFLEPTGIPKKSNEKESSIDDEEYMPESPKKGLNEKISLDKLKYFECVSDRKEIKNMKDISDGGSAPPSDQTRFSDCVVLLTRSVEHCIENKKKIQLDNSSNRRIETTSSGVGTETSELDSIRSSPNVFLKPTRVPKKRIRVSPNTKSLTENERQELGAKFSDSRGNFDQASIENKENIQLDNSSDRKIGTTTSGVETETSELDNLVKSPHNVFLKPTRVPKKRSRASHNTKSSENERQELGIQLSNSRICDQLLDSQGVSIGTRKSTRRPAVCNDNFLKTIFGSPKKVERNKTTKRSVKKESKTNKKEVNSKESVQSTVDKDSSRNIAKSTHEKQNRINKKQTKNSRKKNSSVERLPETEGRDSISSIGSSTRSGVESTSEKENNHMIVDEDLDEKCVERAVKKESKQMKKEAKSKKSENSTDNEESSTNLAKYNKEKKNCINKGQNKNNRKKNVSVEPLSEKEVRNSISCLNSSAHCGGENFSEKENRFMIVDDELVEKGVEEVLITEQAEKIRAKSSENKTTPSDSESTSTIRGSNIDVTESTSDVGSNKRQTSQKTKKRKKKSLCCKIPKKKTGKTKGIESLSKKTIEGSISKITTEVVKSSENNGIDNIHCAKENDSLIVQGGSNDPEHWTKADIHLRNLGKNVIGAYSLEENYGYIALPPKYRKKFINKKYDVFYTRLEGTNSLLSRGINLQEAPIFFVIPKAAQKKKQN